MSINQAIGNAFSGLSAASRASEIVSRNIANASTEGYSATVVNRSQQVFAGQGAGVRIDGVERAGNPLLTADRRRADGQAQMAGGRAQTMRQLSDLVNDPDGGDSLSSRFVALENALRGLADTPESPAMQSAAASAGRALAKRFNTISTESTRMRTNIAADVQRQVDQVNGALKKIAQLNTQIAAAAAAGQDTTALEDARDRQIETVNGIIPINARNREEGGMMISTRGGTLLVEGSAREIEAEQLTDTDGHAVDVKFKVDGFDLGAVGSEARLAPLGGGTLEASMRALTQEIPAFKAQLDSLAADLVMRFQNLDGYQTLANPLAPYADPGNPHNRLGLFSDGGSRLAEPRDGSGDLIFDAGGHYDFEGEGIDIAGLAGRIAFAAEADPMSGGDASLLTTGGWTNGLEADTGAAVYPTALMDAMRASVVSGIGGISGNYNAVDLSITLVSYREVNASSAENEASFQQAAASGLREEELALTAVDTDQELRDLLRIEQAYQANARVLQTVNAMIDALLEL
jgi:flagellar hook-associated protein 1 FlgK